MLSIHYFTYMRQLGLSTHVNQLERRKEKYPLHFSQQNGHWLISKQLATYLADCAVHELLVLKMKITEDALCQTIEK